MATWEKDVQLMDNNAIERVATAIASNVHTFSETTERTTGEQPTSAQVKAKLKEELNNIHL